MQRARRRATYDRIASGALRLWFRVSSRLSLAAIQRLGGAVGVAVYLFGGSPKRVTRSNLEACFPEMPESARRRLTRASLRQTGCYAAELGIAWRPGDCRWKDLIVDVEGYEAIDDARALRRPIVFLVPHYGSWELLSLYLGGRLPLTVLYERPRYRSVESIAVQGRARTGCRLMPNDMSGLRALYVGLRDGEAVGLLPDQVPSARSGEYAPFFGRDALTMTLAHRLIEKFEPCVVLCYAERLSGGRGFRLGFERLANVESACDSEESLAAMNKAIERVVARDPSQYQWEYRRFRRPRSRSERIY